MRYSLLGVLLGAAIAGSALTAPASAAVAPQTVQDFLGNPSNLLAQYPNGGPDMIQAIQDIASADRRALTALVSLLPQANDAQAKAIGTALGRLALTELSTDQAFATQIQTAVVESRNVSAQEAFDAVVGGNIKLTAATTGVGGGGETSTGPGGTGFSVSGPSGPDLRTSVNNVPDVFSSPFASGPGGSGSTTTSVSPSSTP